MTSGPSGIVLALFGHALLRQGILSATVLVPYDHENIIQPRTLTIVKAVESQKSEKILINEHTKISTLRLNDGDLVTLLLADPKPELIKLMPDNFDGWAAFVIGKNLPVYSFRDDGWLLERRYEL